MYRPTGFADLAGRRVGVFGYGVEGRAGAARALAAGARVVIVDDADVEGAMRADAGGLEALGGCEVVLKSPGIPRRRADVRDLEARGVAVTSALNLWLHEADRSRVVGVTGTKGKSTTTSLLTFFLTAVGGDAQSLGNIGRPPYDEGVDTSHGFSIVEVSSFQCVDLDVAPGTVVVTALGSDHLDWHGSLEQYREDKLSLTRAPGRHRTVVPDTGTFREVADALGGEVEFVAPDASGLAGDLGLIGTHNDSNVALALAVGARLSGLSREALRQAVAARASEFVPLRGRLTLIGRDERDAVTVRYVDDGLATSPLPVIAALDVVADEPVSLIAGGFDRGVDYTPLADALARRRPPTRVVTMGPAGRRLGEALSARAGGVDVVAAGSMGDAVGAARAFLVGGGTVLFSPGAPSFDAYGNWLERSEDFAARVREALASPAPGAGERWSLGRDSNP